MSRGPGANRGNDMDDVELKPQTGNRIFSWKRQAWLENKDQLLKEQIGMWEQSPGTESWRRLYSLEALQSERPERHSKVLKELG